LKLYTPQQGEILLNNVSIEKCSTESYRKLFGVAFQNYINYSLKVKDCIGLGNIERIDNLEAIKITAQKTHSDKFIKGYKNGFDTNLGKDFYIDGIEPSGGQWQKLAVSRALYSNAPILILDEPTAALDPKAEDEIFKIFTQVSKDKILIIVSHRMYSARLADEVILFDKGKIIAHGSHLDLMHISKKYKQMFNLQADKYK
jgi:ATP-binding cassette subfamily B protein